MDHGNDIIQLHLFISKDLHLDKLVITHLMRIQREEILISPKNHTDLRKADIHSLD